MYGNESRAYGDISIKSLVSSGFVRAVRGVIGRKEYRDPVQRFHRLATEQWDDDCSRVAEGRSVAKLLVSWALGHV